MTATLLIDPTEFADFQRQQADQAAGTKVEAAEMPVRFPGILDALLTGGLGPAKPRAIVRPRATVMAWHLRPSSVLAALLGRLRVYLCWGVAHHSGWRRTIARLVLRRARFVLVNDDRTGAEVTRLAGVRPHRIPYFVDTSFYTYAGPETREDFLFCPSSNDRDGAVLLALARAGYAIVWMNNDEEHHRQFGGMHPNLTLTSRPSYVTVRDFYHRAAAIVLPLVRDLHAAGQTTTLEAIACGAPVIISAGRTADLLRDHGRLSEMATADPAAWTHAIGEAVRHNRADPAQSYAASCAIAQTHGPKAFLAALRPFLDDRA